MKRSQLYSSSRREPGTPRTPFRRPDEPPRPPPGRERASGADPDSVAGSSEPRWRRLYHLYERPLLVGGGALLALFLLLSFGGRATPTLTQNDIDQAVLHTLDGLPRDPAIERGAFDVIRPSVVWVHRLDGAMPQESVERGMGTGVVVADDGTILTNLHVVMGAREIGVVFADGTASAADVISVQPEHDLAVIRARHLPDDLFPATLISTRDLMIGDRVVAVGFPFGVGPSASSGVVSGLGRNYNNLEGERILTNLIQFDAAVNPGNSGGPLVNGDGHVVGIVTALLNPSQRVFIGIGFAVPIENAMAAVGRSPF